MKPTKPPPSITETEYRLAVHQMRGVRAGPLLETVEVEVPRRGGKPWRGTVRVFAVSGDREAKRCFVWPRQIGDDITIIHTVLESPRIATPQQAVRSRLRGERG